MKRLVLAALLSATTLSGVHAEDKVLNLYNWTDYMDPHAIEGFEKLTGAKVVSDTYDSLETLEGKMLAGHAGYDIIVPTAEPTFARLIAAGALQPLDKAAVSTLTGEDPALLQRVAASDPGNTYGAIYLWGTIGLGEIPSKIDGLFPDAPVQSWDLLFKPENAKKLASCGITMMDSATDVIPTVLKYLGHDPSSTNPRDLADVEKTLMAIRPYIRTFASGGALEALASGTTCLAMDYSGDVIQASRPRRRGQAGPRDLRRTEGVHAALVRHAGRAEGRAAPGVGDAVHQLHPATGRCRRHHQHRALPERRPGQPRQGGPRDPRRPQRLSGCRRLRAVLHRRGGEPGRHSGADPHVGALQGWTVRV